MDRCASTDRPSLVPARPDDMMAAFRALAEASGDVALIVDCADRRLRYLSAGAGQLLGYSADEVQRNLRRPTASTPVCQVLAVRLDRPGRQREECELECTRPDGSSVSVQLVSTFIFDEHGDARVLAATVRDQSPQRAMQAEQRRFASMLNHEFRTPLAIIDGSIQRLEATSANADAATRERYRKIGAAVDRLIGMLDEYLSPERMAALGRTRPAAGVDPGALLDEAATQARAAGRPVSIAAEGLPPGIRGDQQGLRLALKVLVDNALAFSPAASPIGLEGRRVSNGIELIVRDNGAGVPAQDAARIFDKSYRGSNAASLPGSGLGLYMARSVLEVHGGTLDLIDGPGAGAVFKMWLPVLNDRKVVASGEPNSDNQFEQAGGGAQSASTP